jgi:DNA primase
VQDLLTGKYLKPIDLITQKTVQEILETVKVEEVIQDYVTLKRRGVNMIGLCPFHNEKTPSFTVSPAKNIFKCFGCGQAGDAVKFLMEHEQLTFPEALRHLARKYNIEIEETAPSPEALAQQQAAESLYLVNEYAKNYYADQLFHTDLGKGVGLSYFKSRGFREATIKKFGLGFAPDGKDAFTAKAISEGYKIETLRNVGLTSQYDRDFFRNRVMFTIHNLSGKVIGFGGRILQKDIKAPKYINTPETEIYNKSKVLYGIFFAKQTIRKNDECILVEGYTDVISLHQAGIENVVASSGTSLTKDQIRLIKRYTPNVKIIYDGDMAGVKAALRGLDLLLEQDLNVKVVTLPNGEDPDSYLQSVGASAFQEYIDQQAKDFILFKTDLLLKDIGNDPVKKTHVIRDIVSSIGLIPDPIKRSIYIKECARLVDVEEQLLVNESNKILAKEVTRQRNEEAQTTVWKDEGEALARHLEKPLLQQKQETPKVIGDEFQEKAVVRILMLYAGEVFDKEENLTVAEFILSGLEDLISVIDNARYKSIFEDGIKSLLDGKKITVEYFTQHEDPEISQLALDFSISPYEYSENWEKMHDIILTTQPMPEQNFSRETIETLKRFRLRKIQRMLDKVDQKIKTLQEKDMGDPKIIVQLKLKTKLKQMHLELSREVGMFGSTGRL